MVENPLTAFICTCESVGPLMHDKVYKSISYTIIIDTNNNYGAVICGINPEDIIKVSPGKDYRTWISEECKDTIFTTRVF